MSTKNKLAALVGAAALTVGMFGTALAVDPDWATVTGHTAFSSDANSPDYWGENCTKVDEGFGDTYVLEANYSLVVVKSGSGQYANTEFGDSPSAGQTVWADTDGNNVYSPKDGPSDDDWDQGISHIIFCDESTETNPPTGEPTQDTGDITESPTDGLFGNGTSSPADGAWLLVVALGALLASVVVLTPARAKSRR